MKLQVGHSRLRCLPPPAQRPAAVRVRGAWLAAAVLLAVPSVPAQEGLRTSLAGDAAVEARRLRPESLPFTFKSGEMRVLVSPSLGVDFNDNINTTDTDRKQDFILRPQVQLNLNYPVTQQNLLSLDVGFGYEQYFHHDELSTWILQSGSGLSFDIFVKDFWINVHDRFQYVQDSAGQSAVAGTADYGTFENTAGLQGTWDLQDVTLSLGYDHANTLSLAQQFDSQDNATESVVGRAGLRVRPAVTTGVEATASFTAYHEPILNDNSSYSLGVYADWQPGSYLHVEPRIGYTMYQFQKSSQSIRTSDVDAWYYDLTVRHDITEAVSYSLSAGHEIRLGIEADANEVWYVRPGVVWRVMEVASLTTSVFYEHGNQGVGDVTGNFTETYDWFGGNLGFSYPFMKKATLGVNYRLTFRSSDTAGRDYTQNLVGLLLTYQFR